MRNINKNNDIDKVWNCISWGADNAGSNESCGQCNLNRSSIQ